MNTPVLLAIGAMTEPMLTFRIVQVSGEKSKSKAGRKRVFGLSSSTGTTSFMARVVSWRKPGPPSNVPSCDPFCVGSSCDFTES